MMTSLTTRRRPTTATKPRKTGAGSRRPTVAPSWPPMIEPAAMSAGGLPRDVGDQDEHDARQRR